MVNSEDARLRLSLFARVWIVFLLVSHALGVYRNVTVIDDLVSHDDPRWEQGFHWALPTLVGLSLVAVAGLLALLFGRRWGWYPVGLSALATLAVNVSLGVSVPLALLGLGGVVVLWFAVGGRGRGRTE
ncbi:hypothetical protein [Rhizohabitans arisaemae]|uniref:hypothetical protein n=1 Tax=Rhizohabitans arisaemae TaxID=2720610 RepID=UPI0024B0E7D3|nr:hypothetical protein [Rhizohabitans arisaemae]